MSVTLDTIERLTALRWTPYIPHAPHPKQMAFLLTPNREVFFGGAAGGGKSDALLMGALQYVDIPHYAAVLFRRTFTDLSQPGALMDRAHDWLGDSGAHWNNNTHTWTFPSGAKLAFGYLANVNDRYRYQSAEFQFVGFDELTQFPEEDYLYLFSRLRKTREIAAPLRMRAASNPGGTGHLWVRKRFKINADGIGQHPQRPYIRSLARDNPTLDLESYVESLTNLDPVTRQQLLEGNWAVSEDARFKSSWFKYAYIRGERLLLGSDVHDYEACTWFITVDPAASTREGPGDALIWRRMPSWTAIGVWALTRKGQLVLVEVLRFQKEIPEVCRAIANTWRRWSAYQALPVYVETNGLGIGVYQTLARQGVPVHALRPRAQDKLVRATDFINRCEAGGVWFLDAAWLGELEAELLAWTGHPHQQSDQVDMCAYAGIIATHKVSASLYRGAAAATPSAGFYQRMTASTK